MTQEAMIKVSPEGDEVVLNLKAAAVKLESYAICLTVSTNVDVKKVTDDLSMLAYLKKAFEDKRKEYVGPINDHLKSVNEAFKSLTAPLLSADSILRGKVLAYRQEQEHIRTEEEDINALRLAAAQKEMKLKGDLSESVDLVEVREEQPERYRAEAGTLGTAKIPKWELIDFALLPDRFKMENATLIGKVVRAGEREIPGVRIWLEESLRVTTPKGE